MQVLCKMPAYSEQRSAFLFLLEGSHLYLTKSFRQARAHLFLTERCSAGGGSAQELNVVSVRRCDFLSEGFTPASLTGVQMTGGLGLDQALFGVD